MSDTQISQVPITVAEQNPERPKSAEEAVALLDRGGQAFAAIGDGGTFQFDVGPGAVGLPRSAGAILPQEPFAASLSCSDARVPVEQIFGCSGNDIFVTRVAGNVAGCDVVGSLHYAMAHLPTIQVVVVAGHTNCGAITAAVDASLQPDQYLALSKDPQLKGIVDALLGPVRLSAMALAEVYGEDVTNAGAYRSALIEVATAANAAMVAAMLTDDLDRDVYFGVYDLERRVTGLLEASGWHAGLQPAPRGDAEVHHILTEVARAGALSR